MTPIQQKIEQYRKSMEEIADIGIHGTEASAKTALMSIRGQFKRMFPEDTQTLSDHLDKIPGMHEDTSETVLPNRDYQEGDEKWKLTDGIVPTRLVQFDETDNIYPKTQPHSFPPRD